MDLDAQLYACSAPEGPAATVHAAYVPVTYNRWFDQQGPPTVSILANKKPCCTSKGCLASPPLLWKFPFRLESGSLSIHHNAAVVL